jgi:DNA-binding transcriptional LysR family regulator
MHRGSGSEIAEFLKSGTVELAIAGPLGETWSRLDELPLFEEPFGFVVSRTHRLADRNEVEFKDLAHEKLLINTGCEMVEELKACLEANGILDTPTHQVATQEDVLALLKADLGVAIIPVGAVEANGICWIPLKRLNLVRKVSVYTVAGRHRAIACATLFNTLRAADWGFDTGTKPRRRAYR